MVDVQTRQRLDLVSIGEIIQADQTLGLLPESGRVCEGPSRQRRDVRVIRRVVPLHVHELKQPGQGHGPPLAVDVDPHHRAQRRGAVAGEHALSE
eukprot:CAMPEP_0170420052 /NCGR_PEP_ID=MMETSP0117_2-20130122/35135_1 /TAXON_ID=400756 /ORGANISM="Durinskia baltica, Strain CSIRO CS-38" /LENGTH=94 /DNA_ID=CAMNT_0010678461 /DNA_START=409 /DNA_END=690 /DNA_ORIENTATION=+